VPWSKEFKTTAVVSDRTSRSVSDVALFLLLITFAVLLLLQT
jgi:hypothetical protein